MKDFTFKRYVDREFLDEVTVQADTVDQAVALVKDQYTEAENTTFVLYRW
jgi:hypothetical protein